MLSYFVQASFNSLNPTNPRIAAKTHGEMSDLFFTFKSSSNTARNSSLHRISQSRGILSEHDRQVISQYLIDVEGDMRRCEVEASRLFAAMKTLEHRRKGLEKSMELYRSLLSPVHRLPREILSDIFGFCCAHNWLSGFSKKPKVIQLSMVCGRWRDIILSTPSLWSRLGLGIMTGDRQTRASERSLAEITKLFMERSRNMPITLDLSDCLNCPTEIISHLIKSTDRWLDVTFSRAFLEVLVTGNITVNLPMLKRLVLLSDVVLPKQNMFSNCPALGSVECLPDAHRDVVLPWAQIRSLTLRDSRTGDALAMLMKCPLLEEVTLSTIGWDFDTVTSSELITLPHIHSLNIHLTEASEVPGFTFRFATLPLLTSLTISHFEDGELKHNWEETRMISYIEKFLVRSQCTITSLQLENLLLDDHQVLALITLLPALETLALEEHGGIDGEGGNRIVTTHFLSRLVLEIGSLSSSPLLPRLSNLSLVVFDSNLDVNALFNAVVSRWKPVLKSHVESLLSVSVTIYHDGGSRDSWLPHLEALKPFRATGLRFSLVEI
ncbi:hypothetical protein VNI00_015418 [Paramarasmius palmivorus]|uniref:F-box domain-containing protein n=1 Tax=Paramarasmius palmivorus TaxID=297713 RepID=A0AAW0BKP0_9AGAR